MSLSKPFGKLTRGESENDTTLYVVNFEDNRGYAFLAGDLRIDEDVIVYGMPNWEIWNAHCWNIDGYRTIELTTTYKIYQDYELVSEQESKITTTMVHCDFGWKGKGNGYYYSGVFDLKKAASYDNYSLSKGSDYDHYLHLITY